MIVPLCCAQSGYSDTVPHFSPEIASLPAALLCTNHPSIRPSSQVILLSQLRINAKIKARYKNHALENFFLHRQIKISLFPIYLKFCFFFQIFVFMLIF